MIQLTANNANSYVGKLVKTTASTKGYVHLNTKVTPPNVPFSVGTEVGVLQKVVLVGSVYWGLVKLKYPAVIKTTAGTTTYSDLYIAIPSLGHDDGQVIPQATNMTQSVWCKQGSAVFLRKKPQASGDYYTTYRAGQYIGKTDAVARKGGSYGYGDTWYTIQLADGRIGYMATYYCTLTKPDQSTSTTQKEPAPTDTKQGEVPTSGYSNVLRNIIRIGAIVVGVVVVVSLLKKTRNPQ